MKVSVASSHKVNYSIEAFNLLAQYYILLPPKLGQQLIWLNTHGQPSKNIPCALHLEHLNRALKTAICGLGANVIPRAVERAGKCICEAVTLCHRFYSMCGVRPVGSSHSAASQSYIRKNVQVCSAHWRGAQRETLKTSWRTPVN